MSETTGPLRRFRRTIPGCPVFNRGYSPMFDCDAAQEEVYEALAKHVPAISTAVGRCRALAVERNNVDLSSISYQNGWGRTPVENEYPWKLSDMKDKAFLCVEAV